MMTAPHATAKKRPSPITIRGFEGISITGHVRRASTIAWREGMTLDDAIRAAGGLRPTACRAVVLRLRNEPAVIELASAGEVTRLLPGDNVFIEAPAT